MKAIKRFLGSEWWVMFTMILFAVAAIAPVVFQTINKQITLMFQQDTPTFWGVAYLVSMFLWITIFLGLEWKGGEQ